MDKNLISDKEINDVLSENPDLAWQSFDTLKQDISPTTFEIMSRQATINVGMIFQLIFRYNRSCCSR
jgi:hypothetical protein